MTLRTFTRLATVFAAKATNARLAQPEAFAHLVIDVQRKFCDPAYSCHGTRQTDAIAAHIAKITPEFRAVGMPTYMIYMAEWQKSAAQAHGGFHRIAPAESDILFDKYAYSAFENTDLAQRLRITGAKTLLVSGFDIDCCVNATVQDGLRAGFNIWVLADCIGNGGRDRRKTAYVKLMTDHGAELMTARQAQRRLQYA